MKKLIVLVGPSGVGKTTLAKYMLDSGIPAELVRSATTRALRGDGNDGEYIYLSVSDFVKSAETGGMLEYTEYAGNLYGTPMTEIERISGEGRIPLLILDLNGADSVRNSDYPSLLVYLFENINVLEERLYARYLGDAPTPEGLTSFVKRKERNFSELVSIEETVKGFDMLVSNASLDEAAAAIMHAYENGADEAEKEKGIAAVYKMLEERRNGGMPPPPPPMGALL